MKSITIYLPDSAYSEATNKAEEFKMNVNGICSLLVMEGLFKTSLPGKAASPKSAAPDKWQKADKLFENIFREQERVTPKHPLNTRTSPSTKFDVSMHFPEFPPNSVKLAQGFVDTALSFPRVRAFRNERGIGFTPNFVFIEYLRLRSSPGGLGVSFYGRPEDFQNPPEQLGPGRGSYSRAKISNEEELNALIPMIKQAWDLKFSR